MMRRAASQVTLLAAPFILWMATAAPTFVDQTASFQRVKFQPGDLFDNPGAWFSKKGKLNYDRPAIDSAIERIYIELSTGNLDKSLEIAGRLVEQYPNFRVGHLIRGDLLLLKAGRPLRTVGDVPSPLDRSRDIADLREEAIVRLRAYRDRPAPNTVPRELVQLRSDQRYAILIDTRRSRLFLYENTAPFPKLITDFYITQGKMGADKAREGDQKTPLGVYTVTELLPKQKLNDFYGSIALPINYPNEWDKRQGRTGHGIWLHGVPSGQISRPPRASDGCVVLANADLEQLQRFVKVGATPVVISDSLEFVSQENWEIDRQTILGVVDAWRQDFESAEADRVLEHYSAQSYIDGIPIDRWRTRKMVFDRDKAPRLSLNNMVVMRYPSRDDMMLITFDQNLSIDGNNQISKRKQYWVREGTRWRIVHETAQG